MSYRSVVISRMNRSRGLANLVEGGLKDVQYIRPFRLLERTCQTELMLNGTRERIAQHLHAAVTRDDPRAIWSSLDERERTAYRFRADNIGPVLARVGMYTTPMRSLRAELTDLPAEKITEIAKWQHAARKKSVGSGVLPVDQMGLPDLVE